MTAEQAIHSFWSSFGIPAYDEYSVPDESALPYITYSLSYDSFGESVSMAASIWYRSISWEEVTDKTHEVIAAIGRGGTQIHLGNGAIWINLGTPAYQRVDSGNSDIRRIYININAEYITNEL